MKLLRHQSLLWYQALRTCTVSTRATGIHPDLLVAVTELSLQYVLTVTTRSDNRGKRAPLLVVKRRRPRSPQKTKKSTQPYKNSHHLTKDRLGKESKSTERKTEKIEEGSSEDQEENPNLPNSSFEIVLRNYLVAEPLAGPERHSGQQGKEAKSAERRKKTTKKSSEDQDKQLGEETTKERSMSVERRRISRGRRSPSPDDRRKKKSNDEVEVPKPADLSRGRSSTVYPRDGEDTTPPPDTRNRSKSPGGRSRSRGRRSPSPDDRRKKEKSHDDEVEEAPPRPGFSRGRSTTVYPRADTLSPVPPSKNKVGSKSSPNRRPRSRGRRSPSPEGRRKKKSDEDNEEPQRPGLPRGRSTTVYAQATEAEGEKPEPQATESELLTTCVEEESEHSESQH